LSLQVFGPIPLTSQRKDRSAKALFGIAHEEELVVRGMEIRSHDVHNYIKQFQTGLLYTTF
jgi:hypothetical protein